MQQRCKSTSTLIRSPGAADLASAPPEVALGMGRVYLQAVDRRVRREGPFVRRTALMVSGFPKINGSLMDF
jgi:hypothetical protein